MYASCCRPPRFSDPAKKVEERLKAQEEFQKGDSGTHGTDTMFGGRGGRVPWYERGRRFLGQGDGRWTPTPLEEVYYMQDSTFSSHFTLQHLWQLCPWLWSSLRMQPSRRLERAQMIMQLLLVVLCVGWVVLAMVFGILPSAPLIVGAMEALPGLALTPMLTEQLRNLGKGFECETECCAKFHGEIRPYFQSSNFGWVVQSKDSRFYGMLGCWCGRRCIGNVGWHMLRLNLGTVLMKVFVQTWAFLGWISLVSPMNAWATLRRSARALLANKRMSDLLQQQVSFQAMEQQQFEWKKNEVGHRRWILYC